MKKELTQTVQNAYKKFRKQNFQARFEKDEWHKGEFVLSITHNGNQWQGLNLTKDEALKVANAILEKLK
jgi:16S rRNA C1402 (ribose-2'-O) methylase RsmI